MLSSFYSDIKEVSYYVFTELTKGIPSEIVNKEIISKYINRLKKSKSIDSYRLLICMGIDIKTYSRIFGIESNQVLQLLLLLRKIILLASTVTGGTSYGRKKLKPSIQFGFALQQAWKSDFNQFLPKINSILGGEVYTRFVTFDNYIRYTVFDENNLKLMNRGASGKFDPDKRDFYLQNFRDKDYYKNLKINSLGSGTGWVFVGDLSEIQVIFDKSLPANAIASEIVDRLGFYMSNSNLLLQINYPADFKEHVYQSYCLTGDWGTYHNDKGISWGNEYFLSYGGDEAWGRTYSVSGTLQALKERVHPKFSNATLYQLEVAEVGDFAQIKTTATDIDKLNEALIRYRNA